MNNVSMNVVVFDVPAESGGALSILKDFYQEVLSHKDRKINWIFVISKPEFVETENIKILRFPWIKKSWGHRLYFDNFIAPIIVKRYKADRILSLQNVTIPHTNIPQFLYVHQALPFVDYKFTFRENKLFWIYQNIIGRSIVNSIRKADKVIVQSEWIKKACVEKAEISNEKISVILPKVNTVKSNFYVHRRESYTNFFYPASEFEYKNHRVIIDACKELKQKNIEVDKVIFTLKGDENNYISKLFNEVKENKLPIEFVGNLSREQVFDLFTRSVLIFPSYIETFGLPLLEAKLHRGMILSSDCPFSHEILEGYQNAYFFDPFDANELSTFMDQIIKGQINYNEIYSMEFPNIKQKSILSMIIEEI